MPDHELSFGNDRQRAEFMFFVVHRALGRASCGAPPPHMLRCASSSRAKEATARRSLARSRSRAERVVGKCAAAGRGGAHRVRSIKRASDEF